MMLDVATLDIIQDYSRVLTTLFASNIALSRLADE